MTERTELHSDEIISTALDLAQCSDYKNASFEEGLDVLTRSVSACKTLSEPGRASLRRQMIGYLANRFAVETYLSAHPALTSADISSPIFVCGMPRTGTTLLVNLLNQDSSARSLTKWEVKEPVPPAKAGELTTDPRCLRQNEARHRQVEAGKLKANVHFEWSYEPTECVFVLMQDFRSTAWDAFAPMPEYSEFFLGGDMTGAYLWHRSFLQCLQENNKGRWTLKAPGHALFPEALLAAYPDARLVWTHRDPVVAVASHCSLINSVQARYGQADIGWIGTFYPGQLLAHVERLRTFEEANPGRVFHVDYRSLTTDPITTMRRLYKQLGLDFTDQLSAGLEARTAAAPQGKHGEHRYGLEQYSLTEKGIRSMFGAYEARYLNGD